MLFSIIIRQIFQDAGTMGQYLVTRKIAKSKKNRDPSSEFITLRVRVFTNVSRVFYIFFLSRNSREIRYKLRGLRVIIHAASGRDFSSCNGFI